MLYITNLDTSKEYLYHVGDTIKVIDHGSTSKLEVEADGHELTKLQLIFPDLPRMNSPVVIFVGETASFVYANLKNKKFDERVKF